MTERADVGLFVPEITPDDDALSAALKYAAAGWYVVPIRRGTKNPGSVFGANWHTKSIRDTESIVAEWAGTDHGVALHVGRSGGVVFDLDNPERAPDILTEAIRTAPRQRTGPGRGHAVFAAPPGRIIGNSTGELGKGWGEVRGANGVIVVAPSVHPKSDGRYQWLRTGPVPVLPDIIAVLLPDASPGEAAATSAEVRAFQDAHALATQPGLLIPVLSAMDRDIAADGSRHDAALGALCWVAREAAAGYYPFRHALGEVQARFKAALPRGAKPRPYREDEWAGMVGWAVGQVGSEDLGRRRAGTAARLASRNEGDPTGEGDSQAQESDRATNTEGDEGEQPPEAPGPPQAPGLPTLPDEFWDARPILTYLRQAAWYAAQAPDVVLHSALAKIAALRDPNLRVDSGMGAAASLNYYALIVGPSGEGKTTGAHFANELLPTPARIDDFEGIQPLGSGEGVAEAYMGWEAVATTDARGHERTVKIRKKIRDHVMFAVDEGQRILKLDERSGSTSNETLRSAWSGAGIGARNSKEETTRIIPAFSYSLGLIVGIQPHLAAEILTDSDTGTPQRFMWCSVDDPKMPRHAPEPPGEIPWQPDVLTKWVRMDMPQPIKDALREDRWMRKTRQSPPLPLLDSQKPVTLIKLAGLMALLDSRVDVNHEDWELAEIIWATSAAVRDTVAQMATVKAAREREEKQRRLIELQEEIAGRKAAVPDKLTRIAHNVAVKIHEQGIAVARGEVRRDMVTSRDRKFFESAMEFAVAKGWLIASEHGYAPGGSRPVPQVDEGGA